MLYNSFSTKFEDTKFNFLNYSNFIFNQKSNNTGFLKNSIEINDKFYKKVRQIFNPTIPNVCYFVFGFKKQTEEFMFCYFISVYSAYLINKPDAIYFYYHYEPYGKWWDELKNIPKIKFKKINIPTTIGDKKIIEVAHKADIVRMKLLNENGGIYLDIDTICVRPWKKLLKNKVVLGKEIPSGICNAIMMCQKRTKFFDLWLKNYENEFQPNGWGEASIDLPKKLADQYPNLLTLQESDVFFLPSWQETDKIFQLKNDIPKNLISLHLWESKSMKYIKNINNWDWASKNKHTLYGKLLLNLIEKKNNLNKK